MAKKKAAPKKSIATQRKEYAKALDHLRSNPRDHDAAVEACRLIPSPTSKPNWKEVKF